MHVHRLPSAAHEHLATRSSPEWGKTFTWAKTAQQHRCRFRTAKSGLISGKKKFEFSERFLHFLHCVGRCQAGDEERKESLLPVWLISYTANSVGSSCPTE